MIALLFALAVLGADQPAPDAAPFVTQPVWLKLPNGDDMARYQPEDAKASGRAVIECKVSRRGLLTFCKVLEETPGEQYGKAALAIAAKFQMRDVDRTGAATADRKVRIPITWGAPVAAAASTPVKPEWLALPNANEMIGLYPREALKKRMAGKAVIACQLTAAGRAENCVVQEETPTGMGFGEATLRMSPAFQFSTIGPDGQSLVGGTFKIPMVWNPPPN